MQTNNVFDPGRFGHYFKKQLVGNYRLYFMSAVVLSVGLLVLLLFALSIMVSEAGGEIHTTSLYPFYIIGMYFTAALFTSMAFNELGNKPQSIDFLLLPASQFEKFLSVLLLTTVVYQIVYHLAFFVAGALALSFIRPFTAFHIVNDLNEVDRHLGWKHFIAGSFIIQAVFLLGASWMHKFSYIKTAFWLIIFCVAMGLVNNLFANILFNSHMADWKAAAPFLGVSVGTRVNYNEFLMLPSSMQKALLFAAEFLLAPVLWTLSYFRLKDEEA
jgi:hypothetical protein